MNYFALYQLPEAFEVDRQQLASSYQQLQKLTHPDKFAAASDAEKRFAVQKNAQVNDGYQTLKDPLRRAEHMLALRGLELAHEQQTLQDTTFLMQQMEWREALADIDADGDVMTKLEALETEVSHEEQALFEHLSQSLSQQANEQAAAIVRKLKFVQKFLQEISGKEEQLLDH